MFQIGVIAAEFGCYDFDTVAAMRPSKRYVLYKEAQRQRVAKALAVSTLVNKVHQKADVQAELSRTIDSALNPYRIIADVTQQDIEAGWGTLRKDRR